SIAEIGLLLGYEYQSHFCTAFRRKYGMSPTDFREGCGNSVR
ncbi:MAG: helix-turn-helix domain-containing protein, partial [Bacteroidales bacterium]|nr:helix-turn-helix domain-containing protein [Bacteroidales bacterium]